MSDYEPRVNRPPGTIVCPTCNGNGGARPDLGRWYCGECKGSGWIDAPEQPRQAERPPIGRRIRPASDYARLVVETWTRDIDEPDDEFAELEALVTAAILSATGDLAHDLTQYGAVADAGVLRKLLALLAGEEGGG